MAFGEGRLYVADLDAPVVSHLSFVGVFTARLEGWAADGDRGVAPQVDSRAGGRWHAGSLDVGLTAARVSGLPLRYTPSGASEGFTAARGAVRPELGYTFDAGALGLRAALGVALGPTPLEETVELTADLGSDGAVRPRLGVALEHRGWTVERGILSGKLSQTRVVLAAGGTFGG